MKTLVSVIVPNYNHQNFLAERMDSIINQSFQDYEIIIFDDASTDNSLAVLNKYKNHPKVSQFIINEKNSGSPFMQWKRGIELAEGDYIWIAETDDFAEKDFLEKTVAILKQNQKSGFVYSDSMVVDGEGNKLGLWSKHKNSFFKTNRWSNDYEACGRNEVLDYLFYKVTINNASAVLFRRDNLLAINLDKLVKYKNVGDLFTYMSVSLQGNISYISLPLNNYRDHLLNTTKKNQKSGVLYVERISCFGKMIDVLCSNATSVVDKEKLAKASRFITKKNGFGMIDYGYRIQFIDFITKLSNYKILKTNEANIFKFLFKIYSYDIYKLKGLSKKVIKRKLKK